MRRIFCDTSAVGRHGKQSTSSQKTTQNLSSNVKSLPTQVAHQLLLNGKGNKLHVPRREKMPRQTVTESKLMSPFLMEDLLHGVKALKNNKAAGLDDMLCEQIKHFGEATLRWLLQMMNSILKTQKFPKLWKKSKVIAILKPGKDSTLPKSYRLISLSCHTYKLFERMILNRLNPLIETMIIHQQAGFRPGKSTTGQTTQLDTLKMAMSEVWSHEPCLLIYQPPTTQSATSYY